MSQAYDYFWTSRVLISAGALSNIKNSDGHCAINGVDGGMIAVNWIAALTSAHDKGQLEEALNGIEQAITENKIEKSELVMGGMGKKRSSKNIWTKDIDQKFKDLCKKL
jgi:hypothetical protein